MLHLSVTEGWPVNKSLLVDMCSVEDRGRSSRNQVESAKFQQPGGSGHGRWSRLFNLFCFSRFLKISPQASQSAGFPVQYPKMLMIGFCRTNNKNNKINNMYTWFMNTLTTKTAKIFNRCSWSFVLFSMKVSDGSFIVHAKLGIWINLKKI